MVTGMIQLFLVRHGETQGNALLRYQGSTDIPLNDKGIAQAQCLSRHLQATRLDAVYSSTLSRARQTADIIAAPHHLDVEAFDALQEVNFGIWEGHTYEEIRQRWPGQIEAFYASKGKLKAPGGESFRDVTARSVRQVEELLARHSDGDTVMIVCHGGTLRCLLFGLLGLPIEDIWVFQQYNTAVNRMECYPNRRILTLMNSTEHLRDLNDSDGGSHIVTQYRGKEVVIAKNTATLHE